jgi:hypothetical protein
MPYKFNPFTANLDFVSDGSSSSSLDGLSDVSTTNPLAGEFLAYNSATDLWERGVLFGSADLVVAIVSSFGQLNFSLPQNSSHIATAL